MTLERSCADLWEIAKLCSFKFYKYLLIFVKKLKKHENKSVIYVSIIVICLRIEEVHIIPHAMCFFCAKTKLAVVDLQWTVLCIRLGLYRSAKKFPFFLKVKSRYVMYIMGCKSFFFARWIINKNGSSSSPSSFFAHFLLCCIIEGDMQLFLMGFIAQKILALCL